MSTAAPGAVCAARARAAGAGGVGRERLLEEARGRAGGVRVAGLEGCAWLGARGGGRRAAGRGPTSSTHTLRDALGKENGGGGEAASERRRGSLEIRNSSWCGW